MILETAQLLSTAHHELDGEKAIKNIYKATHKNHPSALWVQASRYNYEWALELFENLLEEYTYRYGKIHKTSEKLFSLRCLPKNIPEDVEFFPPPQAMPDEYKNKNTMIAYRNYYVGEKSYFAKWRYSETPDWYAEKIII